MIIYIGSFYIILGSLFLFIPLVYLELGRPKDFIKAALILLIGIILIIKNKVFDDLYLIVQFLITGLIVFLISEIFLSRWHQLTDKEKNKLLTLSELKKNLSKILEAFELGVNNLKKSATFWEFDLNNKNINKKKWVRNDKSDNIDS